MYTQKIKTNGFKDGQTRALNFGVKSIQGSNNLWTVAKNGVSGVM